jgi:hypothetical protein
MSIEFPESGGEEVVHNEFASVSVKLDTTGNSPRLRLEDLRTGRVRYLDALELETLIWLPNEHLTAFMDASRERWEGDP